MSAKRSGRIRFRTFTACWISRRTKLSSRLLPAVTQTATCDARWIASSIAAV
jgi:hypothetical protein